MAFGQPRLPDPALSAQWMTPEAARRFQVGDASRGPALAAATELMLDLAQVRPGHRVLDVAAGTGMQTLAAARRVGPTGQVLATDVSASQLALAAATLTMVGFTNVATRVMAAEELNLARDSFDAVISRLGLHLMDPARALVRIRRVLKPGHKFAALIWGAPQRNHFQSMTRTIADRFDHQRSEVAEPAGWRLVGNPELLAKVLRNADFRQVAVRNVAYIWRFPTLEAAVRDRLENGMRREVLAKLSDAEREHIRAEIEPELRQYLGPAGFVAPGEVLIAVGTK